MDWQKSGYQTFQIMWSTKPHNDCPPSLQVRSFTSDSYRAIKEREWKGCQRRKAASQQWRTVPNIDGRRQSASLDATVDAQWRGAMLDDDIYMSDSRSLQSFAQEDCQVQSDRGTQQTLHQPSAQPTSMIEVDCEGKIQSLDVSTSTASSPIDLGSALSELITDTELESDYPQAMDLKQSSASAHDLVMIVPNDVDTPVEESGSGLLHESGLVSPTSSHTIPIHSCVTGFCPKSCEQPTQGGNSASPCLVSPQPNTVYGLATAPGPFTLAMGLSDAPDHTCRTGHRGPCICQAGFDQAGNISKQRGSVPQILWTKDLDEYLLHLRNVAQLKWGDLVDYFPTMTPSAVKHRHKQLSEMKGMAQVADDQRFAQFEERSTAAFHLASISSKYEPRIEANSHATSILPATSKLAKSCSPLRRRRKTRQANHVNVIIPPALTTCEATPQRSSRCGRPIRHPFRHLPKEGYL